MTEPTRVPPDTSDMFAVHQVFRTSFDDPGRLVGTATAAGHDRVALVADYYANVLAFLHVHHEGEDELVTPRLLDRVGDTAVVEQVSAQHIDVLSTIAECEAALATWAAAPDAATADALTATLARLGRELGTHLDDEEALILPLCRDHLSAEEWGALPGHGMANFGGDKIWLILGLIREHMTDAQRAEMLAHMPPPAVEMWTTFGDQAFTDYVADLRQPT